MNITILILAAGQSLTSDGDNNYPLCLNEIHGVPLLEAIIARTKGIDSARYVFAFSREDFERYHLDKVATLLAPDSESLSIPTNTKGSACTALLAASSINYETELLIISANELVDIDLNDVVTEFRSRSLSGGLLTFQSVHPRYSFVKLNNKEQVIEVAQRDPISKNATTGIFWFSDVHDFINSVENIIRKNAEIDGNFYIAPAYNELLLTQKQVGVFRIQSEQYIPLKNDRQRSRMELL